MESGFDNPISRELVPQGEGAVLAGRFKLIRFLGAGSVGGVFEAYDANRSSNVAVKVFYPALVADSDTKEKLLEAIRLNSSLNHPSVVRVYEAYEEKAMLWVSMEFQESESLATRLERLQDEGSSMSLSEVCRLSADLLSVLTEVADHARHLGLKPQNLFVDRQGRLRVGDFSFQMCVERSRASYSSLVLSAAGYQAPEVLHAEQVPDSRADQYSVAAIGYEMLLGCPPLGTGPEMRKLRPDLSLPLCEGLAKALSTNVDERFPSLTAFRSVFVGSGTLPGWVLRLSRVAAVGVMLFLVWWLSSSALPDSLLGRSFRATFHSSDTEQVTRDAAEIWDRTAIGLRQYDRRLKEITESIEAAFETGRVDERDEFSLPQEELLDWVKNTWPASSAANSADVLALGRKHLDQSRPNQALEILEPVLLSMTEASEDLEHRYRFLEKAVAVRELVDAFKALGQSPERFASWHSLFPSSPLRQDLQCATLLTNLCEFSDKMEVEAESILAAAEVKASNERERFRRLAGPHVVAPRHLGTPNDWMIESKRLVLPRNWFQKQRLILRAAETWQRWTRDLESMPSVSENGQHQNSLGMRFVALRPGLLISVFETRLLDYETFLQRSGYDSDRHWRWLGDEFKQSSITEPVVGVHAENAEVFCQWLTQYEREQGRLGAHQHYRLPTVYEWTLAAGEEDGIDRLGAAFGLRRSLNENFSGVADGFQWTAPVGQFEPNALGLYDLMGNVSEWCSGKLEAWIHFNFVRGASWRREVCGVYTSKQIYPGTYRLAMDIGFRVVLEELDE